MSQEVAFAILISLAFGSALGCIYTLLRVRKKRDKSDVQLQSLKQSAKEMIERGNLTGLNPHKIYKFCIQYEQMSAENRRLLNNIERICSKVSEILRLRDYEHFDGEDIYFVSEYDLRDILEKDDVKQSVKEW